MNKNNICYTGMGSLETGNHTQKQYLAVMNKNSKKECSIYIKSLKCKSCKKWKKMLNAKLKKNTQKMSKKEDNFLKQMDKCNRCKNNKTKKCNLKNYILYSGAKFGKCKDLENATK
jgi:hypothetical protein